MNRNNIEAKDLSVIVPEDGGYLVMPEFGGVLNGRLFDTSPVRQYANVITTGSDSYEVVIDDDEAGATWVSELESRSSTSTPQLRKIKIPVHELQAEPLATQKIIDDSMVNMEQWLSGKVADKFARAENTAFVNGSGNGQPTGFTTYTKKTSSPGEYAYEQLGSKELDAAGAVNGAELYEVIGYVKPEYRSSSAWFMSRASEAVIRSTISLDGSVNADNFLWRPGLEAGVPNTLAGYPVALFEDLADIASGNTDVCMAFGDMRRAYTIVDRIGIRILRDPYTSKPYIKFYTTKRTGGAVVNFDSLKLVTNKSA